MGRLTSLPSAVITDDSALGGAIIGRSLRFNSGDSTDLQRTPSSAGNRKVWTWSSWIKRSSLSSDYRQIFRAGATMVRFKNDHTLMFERSGGSVSTASVFRDVSAWYHIVFALDTTQSTESNRIKLWVNNIQQTLSGTFPAQNTDYDINNNVNHFIGQNSVNSEFFDGYMAEINFVDGHAYDPSYFGYTEFQTGIWIPKGYFGSYGTNGFRLDFSDNSATTAVTLGKDRSGQGNDFTPNNFSVSAGAGNDSLEDTPTNNFCTLNALHKDSNTTLSEGNLKAAGSSSTSYATNTQATFAQSSGKWYYEVEYTSNAGGTNSDLLAVGWARTTIRSSDNPTVSGGLCYRPANADYIDLSGNDTSDDKPQTSTGNVIQVAIDLDAGKIWFGNGGTFFESGNPATGANANITFTGGAELLSPFVRTLSSTLNFNFGQRPFSYTVPTDYKTLESRNLLPTTPSIIRPKKHFDTLTYSGTGATQSITGLEFSPDLVWIKKRNDAAYHQIFDTLRGPTKGLFPNATNAEYQDSGNLQSFTSGGFTADGFNGTNASGGTYVAWNWDAGETDGKTYTVTVVNDSGNKYRFDGFGTSAVTLDLAEGGTYIFNYPSSHPLKFSTTADGTHGGGSEYTTGVTHNSSTQVTIVVAASAPTLYYYCGSHSGMGGQVNTNSTLGSSNFDGTIQVKLKANPTAGFSIGTYSGNGSAGATIGHGLGVKPDAIIIKRKDNVDNWMVYHKQANGGVNPEQYYFELQGSSAQINDSRMMNNTAPTSSVNSLRADNSTNGGSASYLALWFSEVAGYSKFGSYTGNGSSDGTFVFTGFKPALVIFKSTSASENWQIKDNKRLGYNDQNHTLFPNTTASEYTTAQMDFLSNGFKLRNGGGGSNGTGETLIYFAFAEQSGATSYHTNTNAR